MTINLKN